MKFLWTLCRSRKSSFVVVTRSEKPENTSLFYFLHFSLSSWVAWSIVSSGVWQIITEKHNNHQQIKVDFCVSLFSLIFAGFLAFVSLQIPPTMSLMSERVEPIKCDFSLSFFSAHTFWQSSVAEERQKSFKQNEEYKE